MKTLIASLVALLALAVPTFAAEIKLQPISFAGTVASYPNNLTEAMAARFEARVFAILVNGRQLSMPLPSTRDGPRAVRFVVCNGHCSPLPTTLGEMKVANLILANVGENAVDTLRGNTCPFQPEKLDAAFYRCIGPDLQQQVFNRMK